MSVETDLIKGNVEERVKHLLIHRPILRDNDKALWLVYLNRFHDMRSRVEKSASPYIEFRTILLNPKTPMFESISRARRKIQENHPELRGKSYTKRKESAEVIREWAR